jgi:hypothetical protein
MARELTVCENGKGGKPELMNKLYNYYQRANKNRDWLLGVVCKRELEDEFISNNQFV